MERVVEALNQRRKSVRDSNVLILGVAYKKDSDDTRESPALDLMKLLDEKGGKISYHDPNVSELTFNGMLLRSIPMEARALRDFDVVVIVTDHTRFDPAEIVEHSQMVIDTRNLTRGIKSDKVVRL